MVLTAKQERFCQLYALSDNATQSYMEAYGQADCNSAAVCANRTLRNANVKRRIEELQAEKQKHFDEQKNSKIMELDELLAFYTSVVRDANERTETRLKAGRHYADIRGFITQNLNVQGELVTTVEMVGDIDA